MTVHRPVYGRNLDDIIRGDVYDHPWEVTLDGGLLALWQASILDASPLYASDPYAQAVGFRGRVVPPSLVLELALGFASRDICTVDSDQLDCRDVRFPTALHLGDTLRASTEVLSARPSGDGDVGSVEVRTLGLNQHGEPVVSVIRSLRVPPGSVVGRAVTAVRSFGDAEQHRYADLPYAPRGVHDGASAVGSLGHPFHFEDLAPGDVVVHAAGRTIGLTEARSLVTLVRGAQPVNVDSAFAAAHTPAKRTTVHGGLVAAYAIGLASADLGGNIVWELGFDRLTTHAAVIPGDTLFAATEVVSARPRGLYTGELRLRTVGLKNLHPGALLDRGVRPFADASGAGRIPETVVEITRDVLIRRRESVT